MNTQHDQSAPIGGNHRPGDGPLSEVGNRRLARGKQRRQRKALKRLSTDSVYASVCDDVSAIHRGGGEQTDAVILLMETERETLEQERGRPLTAGEERMLHSENTWRKVIKRHVGTWHAKANAQPAIAERRQASNVRVEAPAAESATERRDPWANFYA